MGKVLFDVREALAKANSRAPRLFNPRKLVANSLNDFPVKGEGWDAFVESVRRMGVIHPVLLDVDCKILSGKRRVAACVEAGVQVPAFQIWKKLSHSDTLAIILVANIASRRMDKSAIDALWDRVYSSYAKENLKAGKSVYDVSREISQKSGVGMRTTRRHVYRIQNQFILEKYRTLDDLKVDKPALLKELVETADALLAQAIQTVREYQDTRKKVSEIIRPALVGVHEIILQEKREDSVSAVTGLPEVSIRGANVDPPPLPPRRTGPKPLRRPGI